MQISKVILACILIGMVGNVFAEPVTINCKFDNVDVKKKPEIEFDDNTPNQITVNGKLLPYDHSDDQTKGRVKLVEFNASTISWLDEEKTVGTSYPLHISYFYKINRKTGRITYEFKSYSTYNNSTTERVNRGTCTKIANNGF